MDGLPEVQIWLLRSRSERFVGFHEAAWFSPISRLFKPAGHLAWISPRAYRTAANSTVLSRRVVLYKVELPVPLRMLFPFRLNRTFDPLPLRISLPRILQITDN